MHNTSPYYDLTSNSQRKGLVNELFVTSGLLNDTDTGQSFSFSVSDVMNKEIIEQLHIGQFVVFHPRGASAQIMSVLSTKKARKYAPIDIKWDEAKKRNFFFCGNFLVHERVNFKIENRDMVSFLPHVSTHGRDFVAREVHPAAIYAKFKMPLARIQGWGEVSRSLEEWTGLSDPDLSVCERWDDVFLLKFVKHEHFVACSNKLQSKLKEYVGEDMSRW